MFIGEDVEAELPEALAKVAGDMGVPLADAERALSRIMTRIRVVPLRIGDYLNPAIAGLRRCDPELPRAARGDPDDLGTAAVAEFLAPAVIISKDSVFNRFGLALSADRWTEEAARLLVAAGYDAALEDAAHAAELGGRLLLGVIGAAKNAAVRNPEGRDHDCGHRRAGGLILSPPRLDHERARACCRRAGSVRCPAVRRAGRRGRRPA